jgi:hypothetical protein
VTLAAGAYMPASTLIELPWPPNELSGHHNAHWRVLQPIKKKHREWASKAALAAGNIGLPASGDIRVSATFYPPDRRTDRVNMPTRLKPYWDGIADALGVNDRRFLPTYHYAEPVKNARVVIAIGGAA